MTEVPYNEELFSTTNTKLAATLLTLGLRLRRKLPLEWNDVYSSKSAFWENKINPKKSKPQSQVAFNFEIRGVGREALKQIIEAYQMEETAVEEEFRQSLEGLSEEQCKVITETHSRVVIRACRECLEAREYLVGLIYIISDDAKWNIIKGNGSGEQVKVGKNSSDELVEELLGKI